MILTAAGVIGLAGAQDGSVRGSPDIDISLVDNTIVADQEQTVDVTLLNTADVTSGSADDPTVTTARSLTLEAEITDDVDIEVLDGQRAVGDVPTGQPQSIPVRLDVGDVEPGEYDLEVFVRFVHSTDSGSTFNNAISRSTEELTLEVDDQGDIAVSDVESNLAVGYRGEVAGVLENVGDGRIEDVSLTAQATDEQVLLRDPQRSLPDVEPDEGAAFAFDLDVDDEATPGDRRVQLDVEYDYEGTTYTTTERIRVPVAPEETPTVSDIESSLAVGFAGSITGTVENTGLREMEDATVTVQPASERISVGESQFALADLAVDETEEFQFDADVSGRADPGQRQLTFIIEYESDDRTYTVEETTRVEVGPRTPEFDVTVLDDELEAGTQTAIDVEITNTRDERLESINANLFADSPLSAVEDSGFSGGLDPGESTTVRFVVGVDGGATETTYPLEFDFRYDDARGDERISDVIQVPVTVVQTDDDEDGGFLGVGVILVGVVLVVAVLVYRYRDRIRDRT